MTTGFLTYLLYGAMAAVVIALLMGIFVMVRGKKSKFTSNSFMQLRVALQLVALVIFAVILWRARG